MTAPGDVGRSDFGESTGDEGTARALATPPEASPVSPANENPVTGWARAIVLGIRDTAESMLEAGRKRARAAREEGWERFEEKTKQRRGRRR